MHAPLPSRLGPCADFRIIRRSKFCGSCGHTFGRHQRPSVELPRREAAAAPLFEIVGELSYDPASDSLTRR